MAPRFIANNGNKKSKKGCPCVEIVCPCVEFVCRAVPVSAGQFRCLPGSSGVCMDFLVTIFERKHTL